MKCPHCNKEINITVMLDVDGKKIADTVRKQLILNAQNGTPCVK